MDIGQEVNAKEENITLQQISGSTVPAADVRKPTGTTERVDGAERAAMADQGTPHRVLQAMTRFPEARSASDTSHGQYQGTVLHQGTGNYQNTYQSKGTDYWLGEFVRCQADLAAQLDMPPTWSLLHWMHSLHVPKAIVSLRRYFGKPGGPAAPTWLNHINDLSLDRVDARGINAHIAKASKRWHTVEKDLVDPITSPITIVTAEASSPTAPKLNASLACGLLASGDGELNLDPNSLAKAASSIDARSRSSVGSYDHGHRATAHASMHVTTSIPTIHATTLPNPTPVTTAHISTAMHATAPVPTTHTIAAESTQASSAHSAQTCAGNNSQPAATSAPINQGTYTQSTATQGRHNPIQCWTRPWYYCAFGSSCFTVWIHIRIHCCVGSGRSFISQVCSFIQMSQTYSILRMVWKLIALFSHHGAQAQIYCLLRKNQSWRHPQCLIHYQRWRHPQCLIHYQRHCLIHYQRHCLIHCQRWYPCHQSRRPRTPPKVSTVGSWSLWATVRPCDSG